MLLRQIRHALALEHGERCGDGRTQIGCADHIIDLGPEGGSGGGQIVCTGTPEEVAACPESYTGQYLKPMLERDR